MCQGEFVSKWLVAAWMKQKKPWTEIAFDAVVLGAGNNDHGCCMLLPFVQILCEILGMVILLTCLLSQLGDRQLGAGDWSWFWPHQHRLYAAGCATRVLLDLWCSSCQTMSCLKPSLKRCPTEKVWEVSDSCVQDGWVEKRGTTVDHCKSEFCKNPWETLGCRGTFYIIFLNRPKILRLQDLVKKQQTMEELHSFGFVRSSAKIGYILNTCCWTRAAISLAFPLETNFGLCHATSWNHNETYHDGLRSDCCDLAGNWPISHWQKGKVSLLTSSHEFGGIWFLARFHHALHVANVYPVKSSLHHDNGEAECAMQCSVLTQASSQGTLRWQWLLSQHSTKSCHLREKRWRDWKRYWK